jgi:TM2 domain-containing membrane protein YozV
MLQGSPCTGSCVHGHCNSASRKLSPSACVCDIGWTGIVCDIPVSKLSASSNRSITLPLAVETWQYFWFIVPPSASSFSVTFARLGSTGDPDFYVQQGIPPSVSSFVVHSTQCDSCSPVPLPPAVLHVDSASYKVPLPGLWFAGVFASCCNGSAATISLRVSNADCRGQGPDYVIGCDGVCVESGSGIVDYDTCGICGGNGSSCFLPYVPTPSPPPMPSPQPGQPPDSNPGSVTVQDSQVLQGGSIGAITIAVIYYVCSACVSLFVFYRVRGSVRPVRLRTASFLWCLFGLTGAHRFYTKHTITGFIWLFTGGVCGVGWLVDLFLLQRMILRYNVNGSRMPKFFQGMRNRLKNRVGKNRYRKTINFADDEISLDQTGDDEITLGPAQPRIFDGTVEVGRDGAAADVQSA